MKRISLLFISIILTFCLIGCGANNIHNATIVYKDTSVDIELTDFQSNYYNLAELFPDFDANGIHSVVLEGSEHDFAKIQINESANDGSDTAASGSILRLATYGVQEVNDTHPFSDNLIIHVEDAISATSINWAKYVEFSQEATTEIEPISNVEIMTLYVDIENPCDEKISAETVKFYVNDTAVSDEYFVGNSISLDRMSREKIWTKTSGAAMLTTGVTNIDKLGIEVVLKDSNNNILYDDVQWLIF